MEGAAVAHVAHLYGVPVGEVRGISNMVTESRHERLGSKHAAAAAQEAAARMDRAAAELRVLARVRTTPSRFTRSCTGSCPASRSRRPRRHRGAEHSRRRPDAEVTKVSIAAYGHGLRDRLRFAARRLALPVSASVRSSWLDRSVRSAGGSPFRASARPRHCCCASSAASRRS